ncbi:hypothetical protein [Methylogaea oryzae]|uniref:Uncharacterized protein n=1 Tax=Methylogaea oryzae TaxID=1295382 RepID=A0A8D5AIG1_9GAMM|nr:hypothetical protein [Methylogaea oryzae]BBL69704.1 hypothetical protein MoryE10_03100 [Methylogaea oryzae]
MKLRISQWLDTSDEDAENFPVVYGIQINNGDGKGWLHCHENEKPLWFDTPEAESAKIAEIRAAHNAIGIMAA